jgi:exopolyphosphatase / guanosine-5'-triphosphate,3'-diphosphate pyrophosphatase
MPYASIDVGSNTTRLLVAEVRDGRLRELMSQRAYTRLGKAITKGTDIPDGKVAETAAIVERQARQARELGAREIVVVGTAAVRAAANRDDLVDAIEREAGLTMRVLSEDEEATLSFIGATRTAPAPLEGTVAVIDVGGGSTEIVVGTLSEGVAWSSSFSIGSGFLADSYLHSDPPSVGELEDVRRHVAGVFEGLELPHVDQAVAVGGTANALRRIVGTVFEHETLERAIRILAGEKRDHVSRRFEIDMERVHILPGGVLIFEQLSDQLGLPLAMGKGGLRDGVLLEIAANEGARG